MKPSEILFALTKRNIQIWVKDGRLRYRAPKGALTSKLRQILSDNRNTLIEMLGKESEEQVISYPISYNQQSLWFLYLLAPHSPSYNIGAACRVKSEINKEALQEAFKKLALRHPVLRTTYGFSFDKTGNAASRQYVHNKLDPEFICIDTRNWGEEDIRNKVQEHFDKPFDLKRGPILRAHLFTHSSEDHVMLIAMHHIASDASSLNILFDEIPKFYQAEIEGRSAGLSPLTFKYTDYIRYQDKMISEDGDRLLTFWESQLAESQPLLHLPTDYEHPPFQQFKGATHRLIFEEALYKEIKAFARKQNVTIYVFLLSIFQTLLMRYSNQRDISIGSLTSGRVRSEYQPICGYFVNPIVLRSRFFPDMTFREHLLKTRSLVFESLEYQSYPFPLLVEKLGPEQDSSRSPFFQVLFSMLKRKTLGTAADFLFNLDPEKPIDFGPLRAFSYPVSQQEGQFDLTLEVIDMEDYLLCDFKYRTDLFDEATIARFAGHYLTLLKAIIKDADLTISLLPILTENEQKQILSEWNATEAVYPEMSCIHQLFEKQVEKTPDVVAVVFEDKQLTYRELNQRANRLAHYLQSIGVGPEVLVGIAVERSLEMVIALYGILKAGAAYLPIDPAYPSERIANMLEDSRVPVLLTQSRFLDKLPRQDAKVICLDTEWENLMAGQSMETPECKATLENLAYIIYTSGSTGRPKGVMNTHHGILNRLLWMQEAYQLNASDRVLQKTPFSFDVSVWEFFWPLMFGARLVVARPEGHRDNDYLVQIIKEQQITTIHFVPSMLRLFLKTKDVEECKALSRVICSGEAFSPDLQNRFFSRLDAKLYNLYGPTEAAVDVASRECCGKTDLRTVPIGRPIANSQLYILDRYMQPVPVGVSGELYIGGVQVARGYLNRPDLTAEKFIPDPFSDNPKARLFKTGDICRYLPDGNIEYSGRLDHQVKVRGFRIEPGEIESVLSQHPEVREAVVLAREDVPDDKRLVAYVVTRQQSMLNINDLRNFLKEKLPEYMVPAAFVPLDALPLTPNGKVDRRALPVPKGERQAEMTYVSPQNELEKIIAGIWRDLLQVEKVGVHDNFFDLGGHSLLIVQAHSRLHKVIDRELSITDMFRYPTIEKLARFLTQEQSEEPSFEKIYDRARKQKEAFNRQRQLLNKSNRSEGAGNSCQGAE